MKRRTKMQRRKNTTETKRKKKRNKWFVYDVESRGLKIEIVKDLIPVVFASAVVVSKYIFSFWQLRPLYYFKKKPLDYV